MKLPHNRHRQEGDNDQGLHEPVEAEWDSNTGRAARLNTVIDVYSSIAATMALGGLLKYSVKYYVMS